MKMTYDKFFGFFIVRSVCFMRCRMERLRWRRCIRGRTEPRACYVTSARTSPNSRNNTFQWKRQTPPLFRTNAPQGQTGNPTSNDVKWAQGAGPHNSNSSSWLGVWTCRLLAFTWGWRAKLDVLVWRSLRQTMGLLALMDSLIDTYCWSMSRQDVFWWHIVFIDLLALIHLFQVTVYGVIL